MKNLRHIPFYLSVMVLCSCSQPASRTPYVRSMNQDTLQLNFTGTGCLDSILLAEVEDLERPEKFDPGLKLNSGQERSDTLKLPGYAGLNIISPKNGHSGKIMWKGRSMKILSPKGSADELQTSLMAEVDHTESGYYRYPRRRGLLLIISEPKIWTGLMNNFGQYLLVDTAKGMAFQQINFGNTPYWLVGKGADYAFLRIDGDFNPSLQTWKVTVSRTRQNGRPEPLNLKRPYGKASVVKALVLEE